MVGSLSKFAMDSENCLVWNVRGLNSRARRDVVRLTVEQERVSLICLQETKLDVVDDVLIHNMLGVNFAYYYLPADRSRGGIIIAWRSDIWSGSNFTRHNNSLTIRLTLLVDGFCCWLTTVYGPQAEADKVAFLQELRNIRQTRTGPWMLCGDFNMIYRAADKNNDNLHRRMMGRFRRFLNDLELKELHLHGRLYTWSNERSHPTLEKIDRIFVSVDWEDRFNNALLRCLATDCSDHAPLLLNTNSQPTYKKRFRFESIWTKFPGFLDAVRAGWEQSLPGADAFRSLDFKLRNTAKALQSWSQKFVGSIRLQLALAREVVARLEAAQDRRPLIPEEHDLRRELKCKILGLASLARTIARQRSRITFLSDGDANTRFFHLQACHRSRKNFIASLQHNGMTVVTEDGKAGAAFNYYDDILGTRRDRTARLNFDALGLPTVNLQHLDVCFSEAEIWATVSAMPSDKSPGPDGFTGLFYKVAWPIIKEDIIRAFNALWSLDSRSFHLVNDAFLILLRKKQDAHEVRDYRPISLIHSFSKLFAKALSLRLAPELSLLVQPNQSAFIKGRLIHDNFRAVQLSTRLLHARRKESILLKVDIAKAFDTVNWIFLFDLLHYMGFSRRWINWIAILLSTASTKILLNGNAGRRICHERGLRQGDPISPMLFVLVMEALNALIERADTLGLFTSLDSPAIKRRASLYADDLVVFMRPTTQDLRLTRGILDTFAAASGLQTNVNKCQFSPIRCDQAHIDLVLATFPCQLGPFPCKYLGIPLSPHKLSRVDVQPLVDKVADRLPTWKSNLLNRSGRVLLTKVTLTAIPVYLSIAIGLPLWAIKAIEKLQKGFVWNGLAEASGGQCMVAWSKACRPIDMGGLGILDLRYLGFALRMRWEWMRRTDDSRTWVSLPATGERSVLAMFAISVDVVISDGRKALFWRDRWIQGRSIEFLAPHVFQAVPQRLRNTRTVRDALANNTWIQDIRGARTFHLLRDFLVLLDHLPPFDGAVHQPDQFIWRWSSSGQYSSASAYRMFFTGQTTILGAKELAKTRAPAKCKFFAWLALLGRCWTSERLQRHNLQNSGPCALCAQAPETIHHLLLGCVYSREVWFRALRPRGLQHITPASDAVLADWWIDSRKRVAKDRRKAFDSTVLLFLWNIWKERNKRVFQGSSLQVAQLLDYISREEEMWTAAGFRLLGIVA